MRAVLGWTVLVVGLLAIDTWTSTFLPYDDDGVFPDFGSLFVSLAVAGIVFAAAIRREALIEPLPEQGVTRVLARASVPLGTLAAVAFMHWLRNCLAGAEPAMLIHFAVVAAFAGVGAVSFFAARKQRVAVSTAGCGMLSFAVAGLLLTVANAAMGFRTWNDARDFAGGSPYCLMTYGGFEHRREAHEPWELSPLVNRYYGVWAIRKTPFLVVGDGPHKGVYRFFPDKWRGERDRPQCSPRRTSIGQVAS